MKTYTILSINPGSTSTKIAIFDNESERFTTTIRHSAQELEGFNCIAEQFEFRRRVILETLKEHNFDISTLDVIVGRGGLLQPLKSGVYQVSEKMKGDLQNSPLGEHASNLGGLIADDIARSVGGEVRAYIADPVVVDEMDDVARMTGFVDLERKSIFHALNQKAVARIYAKELARPYEDLNLIVAHLGGGISVGAHRQGMVVDVNNALDGEGPFSPERAGTVPVGELAKMCFSGKYTLPQIKKMINGEGGMMAHLGTNDGRDVRERGLAGDAQCQGVIDAMAYNIAKNIGAMAAVLKGKVDGIILTGGMAYGEKMMEYISEMVGFIAPVKIYPGEDEMSALAMNGLMVLRGEITVSEY